MEEENKGTGSQKCFKNLGRETFFALFHNTRTDDLSVIRTFRQINETTPLNYVIDCHQSIEDCIS